jgi:outer membrane protein
MKKKMAVLLAVLLLCLALPVHAAEKPGMGYVNRQKILANYPGLQEIRKSIETQRAEAQKEYEERVKNLTEQERRAVREEISLRVAKQEADMMNPVWEKIREAIAKVAKANNCDHVIEAAMVHYVGKDLTDLVIKELGGK